MQAGQGKRESAWKAVGAPLTAGEAGFLANELEARGIPCRVRGREGDRGADEPVAEDVPRLGELVIEGNTRTDETLIRREMGLVPGQPFSYDDMDAIWDHLEDLGYFAFVDMEYDDMDPEHVVLRVMVRKSEYLTLSVTVSP